jgi:peptidoglycan/xylan/chitin deacetylase (PgdA/CDA1 family)
MQLVSRSALVRTIAAITVCAAAWLPLGVTTPASAASTPVVSLTPLVDAPGSAAMTIVTVTNIPAGWNVTLSARVGSLPTSCGFRWGHGPGASLSQQCYVTLPARVGAWVLSGTATLTRAGQQPRVYRAGLVVTTQGPVSRPVSPSIRALITKCYNTTGNVRLTFDDGFTSQANLNSILSTLRVYNVRAVFFPTGVWARSHPSMIRQIKAAGQRLGDHTYSHPHLNGLSNAAFRSQVANGQPANMSPRLLRPPGGAGAYSTRSYALAQAQGYRLCYWGVDTRDWSGVSAGTIVNKVLVGDSRTPPARAGDTILMHMSNTQSRYALPTMIRALRAKGLPLERLR